MKELFDISDAKQRGGDAADERPDAVDELLAESETLGYRNGEPLAEGVESYDAYPQSREEWFQPETGAILQSVAESEIVYDMIDAADELNTTAYKETGTSTLEDAIDLHGISLPASVPDAEKETPLKVPDGEGGTITVPREGPDWPTAYHLYVTLGLSAEEMATLLDVPYNAVYSPLSEYGMV
ncbi:hypothetical protein [Haloferax volcanii]|uniref:hypothetical protein n=1 Tax=Haloferax volcanii TaxID=2246 RepID=UPI001266FCE1|nr:hypothetical protein [Haloferax lucentense]